MEETLAGHLTNQPHGGARTPAPSSDVARPVSVNFHLWKPCNLDCRFCYATFRDLDGSHLSLAESRRLLAMLREAGCDKLTFAGGEPTLCPWLGDLIAEARRLCLTTSIVSNGARLRPLLEKRAADIDWIGLSVDSAREDVQRELGRGGGDYVRRSIELFDLARERNIIVKLNTVVTALSWEEDMTDFVRRVRPKRWKVFQVTAIDGQNNGRVEPLLITREQFQAFVDRHMHLAAEGFEPVAEDNDAILGSYVMIDPRGRFFGDATGTHVYSDPILDVGVERALAQVRWDAGKFVKRGGLYQWRRPPASAGEVL